MDTNKLSLLGAEEVLDFFKVWAISVGSFSFIAAPFLGTIDPIAACFEGHPELGYTKSHLLSKAYVTKSTSRRENAMIKFDDRERVNRAINRDAPWRRFAAQRTVQRRVAQLLGPLNASVLRSIIDSCHFGPGVIVGTRTHDEASKVRTLTITRELLPYATQLLNDTGFGRFLLDAEGPVSVLHAMYCVSDAKVTTVDKSATTDRVITVEPALNCLLQMGIGSYLRKRLKQYRFHDLTDQSHNQRLAKYPNATIDLSDASNSLTTSVVKRLVPKEWFNLFDLARSHRYTLSGQDEPNSFELFAGQGNGFCFPLETIIFSAISYAASDCSHPLAVYGDDIIVQDKYARTTIGLLVEYGFKVNVDKSHYHPDDPIRESCGVHNYLQSRIPVLYLRLTPDVIIAEAIITFHNTLYELTTEVRSFAAIRFMRVLRRMVPTIGSSVPNGPGTYFHTRKYNPKVKAIVKRVQARTYRGIRGYSLALYHKVERGAASVNPMGEKYANRDCTMRSVIRLVKVPRRFMPEPEPIVFDP